MRGSIMSSAMAQPAVRHNPAWRDVATATSVGRVSRRGRISRHAPDFFADGRAGQTPCVKPLDVKPVFWAFSRAPERGRKESFSATRAHHNLSQFFPELMAS